MVKLSESFAMSSLILCGLFYTGRFLRIFVLGDARMAS